MSLRTRVLPLGVLAVAILGFAPLGCQSPPKGAAGTDGNAARTDEVALCAECGQIKGDAKCCQSDAATCAECGLAKGSPGCCNMKKGQPASLCAHCGQIKGSAACCKPGAETCATCGLAKGSPGCCKIKKAG